MIDLWKCFYYALAENSVIFLSVFVSSFFFFLTKQFQKIVESFGFCSSSSRLQTTYISFYDLIYNGVVTVLLNTIHSVSSRTYTSSLKSRYMGMTKAGSDCKKVHLIIFRA